jgi:hypothetical protein
MFPTDVPDQEYQVRVGSAVVTADGHTMGKVIAADPLTLTVEKGLLFKRDYLVPRSAINRYDPNGKGTVYLSLTQDQALTSGWEESPD